MPAKRRNPRRKTGKTVPSGRRNRPAGRGFAGPPLVSETHKSASLAAVSVTSMPLFPPTVVKRLRYSMEGSVTATSGVPGGYVFRANDLFDPDYTSTGHQPMGFDQMMLSYSHFCVLKAKIRVIFQNISAGTCSVGIRQDASFTLITVPDQFIEFGGIVYDHLEAKNVYGSSKELSLELSMPRLQGITKRALTADPTLRGDAANSPTELTYFHVMVWDRAGNTVNCDIEAVLDQISYFMEPRDLVESLKLRKAVALREVTHGSVHTRDFPAALKAYDSVTHSPEHQAALRDFVHLSVNEPDPPETKRAFRPGLDCIQVSGKECFHRECNCRCTHI